MRKIHLLAVLLALFLASAGIAAGKGFKATLAGNSEVPPLTTMAKGEATFELGKDGRTLDYRITVSDIENVTAAHVHEGKMGKSGPPIALIAIGGKKEGKFSGTLAEGTITEKDLLGPLKGKSVRDLVKEIEAGNAYVNVHTGKSPGGEVRGQIE